MANRSNIMGLHGLKNKTSRNSFDLSHRNLFTAKVGELLPCAVFEMNPGDTISLDSSYFTRTAPLDTAAFTRLRENVQFFFVPYSLLWKYFNSQVMNMTQTAAGGDVSRVASGIVDNAVVSTQMPFIDYRSIKVYLNSILKIYTDKNSGYEDIALNNGELRSAASAKLLQLLGYGNFPEQNMKTYSSLAGVVNNNSLNLSIFRLLAYQKICNDHYTYRQWQPYDASLCNIDYLVPSRTGSLNLGPSLTDLTSDNSKLKKLNMFDLRFSNLPLDYFNGVLPTAQFGSESVVNLANSGHGSVTFNGDTGYQNTVFSGTHVLDRGTHSPIGEHRFEEFRTDPDSRLIMNIGSADAETWKTGVLVTDHNHPVSGSGSVDNLSSSLSILALRQATALQKYKEIQLANDADFVSQIEAHFGIKPKHDSDTSIFIGGSSSMIDINPQVNQNLADWSQTNAYKGAPTGSGSAKMKFTADTYGVVMGIYRCTPVLDYAHVGVDRTLLKTDASDFVIPELDSIGMQQNIQGEVIMPTYYGNEFGATDISDMSARLSYGYAPRYAELKTSFDRYNGAFCFGLKSWVTGLNVDKLIGQLYQLGDDLHKLNAVELFNCRPDLVSSIFLNQETLVTDDDNLYVGLVNMAYVVRNLSRYGLPYTN
jgi:hypothetical protein|nr:MAG TPA: Major capsid protein [Microviridae sp.]